MAEEIIIRTVFDTRDGARKMKQDLTASLNDPQVAASAKQAGKKIGDALGLGIETTRRGREDKELAHMRRLETISAQSNARIVEIERRKQAQLDLARERSAQRAVEHERKIQREVQRTANSLEVVRAGVGKLTAALSLLGGAAIFGTIAKFGIDLDRQVNSLKALTGSAEAAQKRFQELFNLARASPGLTTNLALTLDAQLRVFNVAAQTIDKLLPVIGKLNAISPLGDPRQFVNNLTQLISQNFERQDLKELVGQSPIAGQLIKQIFNVDNPTNAEAIRQAAKRLGVTTVERLAEELVKAADSNAALKNATESIGGRLTKAFEQLKTKLAPIGLQIIEAILPAIERLLPILNKMLELFNALPSGVQAATVALIAFSPAINTLTGAIGGLKGAMVGLGAFLRTPGGVAALALVGLVTAGLELRDVINNQAPANVAGRINPQGLQFGPGGAGAGALLPSLTPGETLDISSASKGITLGRKGEIVPATVTPRRSGGGITGSGARRAVAAQKTPVDLLFFAQSRQVDRAAIERAQEQQMDALVREFRELSERPDRQAQLAGFNAAQDERLRQIEIEDARLARNTAREAAEALAKLPPILSDSERFMKGFADATETVGDAFERFGQNVARAFTNVRDLFNGLKRAVLDFFNDLIGSTLQRLVRGTLGSLFGSIGGGLGGVFGGGGISAPASVSGGAVRSVSSAIGGGGLLGGIFGGGGGGGIGGGGFSLGALGGSLAAAAPLLGLGLGSALGGTSTTGQILGAIGGGAVGLGAAFGAGVFGAGGGLAAASLAALGPIALIGAPLLVGAILLGKASQRRKDEQASGEFLTQALSGIEQLAAGVASGQIDGARARSIFDTEILGTFRQQIGGLKTKSVRESRLTNQVRDLENVFQARIPPLIAEQQRRAAESAANSLAFSRQIPEFDLGGTTRGGLALLHPGEKILNLHQQSAVIAQSNPGVFDRAGVPGPGPNRVFDIGGTMSSGGQAQPMEINFTVLLGMSKSGAQEIAITGMSSSKGRAVTVNNVKVARTNREL